MRQLDSLPLLLPVAAAAALCVACGGAHAAPVLMVSTSTSASDVKSTPSPSNSADYQGSSIVVGGPPFSSTAFAASNGAYGVKVFNSSTGGWTNSASAESKIVYTLSNATGSAQHYTMTFHIFGGSLSLSGTTMRPRSEAGHQATESYRMNVTSGSTTLFSTQASLASTVSGSGAITNQLTKSGYSLSTDSVDDQAYSWDATDITIDLGLLDAGSDREIAFDAYVDLVTNIAYENTAASFGDPIAYGNSTAAKANAPTFTLISDAAATVPEPASLALVTAALGIGGVVGRRRRGSDTAEEPDAA